MNRVLSDSAGVGFRGVAIEICRDSALESPERCNFAFGLNEAAGAAFEERC